MNAEDYKKLASAKQVTEEVELPSGAVFTMRTAPIQQWVASGTLPAALAAKMQMAAQSKDAKETAKQIIATFTEEDFVTQQILSKRMLEFCCVEPKVSVSGDNADAIVPEDILPDDFEYLMKWIWSGGKAGESLSTFRRESEQPVMGGTDGTELLDKAVPAS